MPGYPGTSFMFHYGSPWLCSASCQAEIEKVLKLIRDPVLDENL